jgi:hypothetical protein
MIQVELNKKNENPFYGLRNCLRLLQASTDLVISESLINEAWNEVKNSKEILNFLKKKIEALTDYTSARSFDEQWKHKEFSLLRKYFEYSKI